MEATFDILEKGKKNGTEMREKNEKKKKIGFHGRTGVWTWYLFLRCGSFDFKKGQTGLELEYICHTQIYGQGRVKKKEGAVLHTSVIYPWGGGLIDEMRWALGN